MPEKANISRTLILPLMSIILLVSVYMTANVLLPLKADGKGNGKDDYVSDNQHLSDDAGSGEAVEMNINFSEKCIVIDSGHGGADPGKVPERKRKKLIWQLQKNCRNDLKMLRLMLL